MSSDAEIENSMQPNSSGSQDAADFVEKINDLKIVLTRDLIACDAKWTLFATAALSYRYESQLKPFPPKFVSENVYNIEALISVINQTPALNIILKNLIEENYDELNTEVIDLLHWVLVSLRDPFMRTICEEEYDRIIEKISQKSISPKPTFVFELCPSDNSKLEKAFQKQKKNFKTKFAFHGSKLYSFYSILNHSLHQHMCKNSLFGEGIYLSSELSVSLNFSPYGAAWKSSGCGPILSCVAVCEYIENPDDVNFQVEDSQNTGIPKTYIVITNNEIVRVRYLLFYGSRLSDPNSTKNMIIGWIKKNRYIFTLICYTVFLTSIGFANSEGGLYLKHLINKKISTIFGLLRKYLEHDAD